MTGRFRRWIKFCTLTWNGILVIKAGWKNGFRGKNLPKTSIMVVQILRCQYLRCNERRKALSVWGWKDVPHFGRSGRYVGYRRKILVFNMKWEKGECTANVIYQNIYTRKIFDMFLECQRVDCVYIPERISPFVFHQLFTILSRRRFQLVFVLTDGFLKSFMVLDFLHFTSSGGTIPSIVRPFSVTIGQFNVSTA